ncbi:alpha/beta hydrolase fold superfamily protein [Arthrobacter crystallopoietes BAB-32]|uniref:Alpha/beta hydrolase fold superfamily protein n=1 Tax=Arthrobacter crystallopoietes BAB-32 TaxID=1246476 RepID=N1V3L5_9MICC|nr:alpha/beta hydrolase [Arthrobacter crystallopoietes]EMY32808.1 alpha/beta hydrolase fold superfamily protein [Arthrobacter crystallopoietes BAB-32]
MRAPVVLLHGWACPASYWNPVAARLRAAGREVLNLDLPGYGKPVDRDFEWTVENVAAAFALELSVRSPIHWVGHSLGGSIAATIAARYPRTTASLTLVGMVPVAPSAAAEEKLRRLFGGPEPAEDEAADEMLAAWFRGGEEPQGEDREKFLAPFRLPPAVVRQSMEAGITGAAPDVPDLITAPTLVVTGTRDGTRTPEIVREFLDDHPGWSHELVTDAGHMVHWERPDVCADAVLQHVERAEGRRPRQLEAAE